MNEYGGSSNSSTHYEVLCVGDDASYEEIRARYREALINLHPDKHGKEIFTPHTCSIPDDEESTGKVFSGNPDGEQLERFLRVQKAWEILKDPPSRKAYDHALQASRLSKIEVVANDIGLDEMDFEQVSGDYFHPCRCGDLFSINLQELLDMGFKSGGGSTGNLASAAYTVHAQNRR